MPTTDRSDRMGRKTFRRNTAVVVAAAAVLATAPGTAQAQHEYTPGAPGIGDPYFPLDGNGGYDVAPYGLQVAYDPKTDVLTRYRVHLRPRDTERP